MRLLIPACILAWHGAAAAQVQVPDSTRSTRTGVYTSIQAVRGREIYLMNCASCHTAASHTGPGFVAKWDGHQLLDLFEYIRTSMPKSAPGTLTRREYTQVTAYLLKMNGMPAGAGELPADSMALTRIRIELKTARDSVPER